jgi:uncharacterized protein YdeI (YjbR/CyaY-like superfamily)
MAVERPEIVVEDAAAWRTWLEQHHEQEQGIWLRLAKKGARATTSLRYSEALEEALCYGWIDGQARRRDDATYDQLFTPRRRRSLWSRRNVALVGRLTEEGRMRPAGLAEVHRAQQDGRWNAAYAGPAAMAMPEDLSAALDAEPGAREAFDGLSGQGRYSVLHTVTTARTPETRARRIAAAVAQLAAGTPDDQA